MNALALLTTIYLAGFIATTALLMSVAPDPDGATASMRVMVFRSATLAVLWPATLVVFALAFLFPPLGDWIKYGSK